MDGDARLLTLAQVGERLAAWVRDAVGEIPIVDDLHAEAEAAPRVVLRLLHFGAERPVRGNGLVPLQFRARYLVAVSAQDANRADDLLAELAFAAAAGIDGVEVDLDPPAPNEWLAMGAVARPAFCVRALLSRPRQVAAPRVRAPLVLETTPVRTVAGRVVGPEGGPVPGARVSAPLLKLNATTDVNGRFLLGAVPSGVAIDLTVSARGAKIDVVLAPGGSADPVITLDHRGD